MYMSTVLVCTRPHSAGFQMIEERAAGEKDVTIDVLYATVKHGTERAAFRGEDPHEKEYYDESWQLFLPRESVPSTHSPFPLGSQFVGRVRNTAHR